MLVISVTSRAAWLSIGDTTNILSRGIFMRADRGRGCLQEIPPPSLITIDYFPHLSTSEKTASNQHALGPFLRKVRLNTLVMAKYSRESLRRTVARNASGQSVVDLRMIYPIECLANARIQGSESPNGHCQENHRVGDDTSLSRAPLRRCRLERA